MNGRKIHEDLGRAKASCQRLDFMRALHLTIGALKELGGMAAPADLRSDFREVISSLAADPQCKKNCPDLAYQPGKEPELRARLSQLHNSLLAQAAQEDYEAALQRKLAIDHALHDGKTFLQSGKVAEAEASFAKALQKRKDENAVFAVIARAYMQAGEYARALGHLREGLKLAPDDAGLRELAEECANLRQEQGK